MRYFQILDIDSKEILFQGNGLVAQDVYDAWLRVKGMRIEGADEDALESEDETARARAFAGLQGTDTWIEDNTIIMQALE